ncbi:hypothetical protein CNO08_03495 [Lysobacter capsici]|nr:hypothetical protein CNO08_03495 [Lysobacter capsici]
MANTSVPRFACAVMVIVLCSGCMNAIRGGPGSVLDEKFADDSEHVSDTARELNEKGDNKVERNKIIRQRLMMIDMAYHQYVRKLQQEQTTGNLFSDIADLALGVAGTLTGSSQEMTRYAGASALLAGSSAAVNRRVLFEQTTTALVSAMDAFRSQVRLRIVESAKQETEQYPPQEVYYDLAAYEFAGTLLGGISYVQSTAEKQKKINEADIDSSVREIYALNVSQRALKRCLTASLAGSNANRTLVGLNAAGAKLAPPITADASATADQVAQTLQSRIRDAKPDELVSIKQAFVDAQLISDCKEE